MRRSMIGVVVVAIAMLIVGTSMADTTELVVSTDGHSMTFTGNSIDTRDITLGGWSINVLTLSNTPNLMPFFGIDINELSIQCSAAPCVSNPLTVMLSSTGFTEATHDGFIAGASAFVLPSAISYTSASFWNASNALGGTSSPINTHLIAGPSERSLEFSVGGGPAGPTPYSLTLVDTYTASAVGPVINATISEIAPVPEPSTMLLFGSGLLLLGIIVYRKELHAKAGNISTIDVA